MDSLQLALPSHDSFVAPTPKCTLMTNDPRSILAFAVQGYERHGASALVTRVEIIRGAARSVGAQMAVHPDGSFCGFVSGGCTEIAVAAEAMSAIHVGVDRFLLGEASRFFDIVLACGGAIKLHIHVIRHPDRLFQAIAAISSRQIACLAIDIQAQSLSFLAKPTNTGWSEGTFQRLYPPTSRLTTFGSGIEGQPIASLASTAGLDVVALGKSDKLEPEAVDSDTAVVLLPHDLEAELLILVIALRRDPLYIGALGSEQTHAKRLTALRELGFSDHETDTIRAPIGLVPKARDAQTLALSVLAEIVAVRNQSGA
jgi:xanthine dehydrogenase accessory factor